MLDAVASQSRPFLKGQTLLPASKESGKGNNEHERSSHEAQTTRECIFEHLSRRTYSFESIVATSAAFTMVRDGYNEDRRGSSKRECFQGLSHLGVSCA
jgi:hypothetical protein